MTALPRVAVVYGKGAAGPAQIARAAVGLAEVMLVVDGDDEAVRPVRDLLPQFCREVIDIRATPATEVLRELADADGITTFAEGYIRQTSRLAAELGLPYHDEPTARLLTDKHRQRTALNLILPEATPTALIRHRDDLAAVAAVVGFPLIVKPVVGAAGAYTFRCDTMDELENGLGDVLDGRGEWVAEALLADGRHPGGDWLADYVSVESITRGSVTRHLAITDKLPLVPPFRETGMVLPTMLPADVQDQVNDLAGRAVRGLGVRHGLTHTEIKLTPAGPRIIEVNGRLGGRVGHLINRVSGVDPVRLALADALGLDTAPPTEFRRATVVYGVLPPTEVVRVTATPTTGQLRPVDGVWRVDRLAEPGAVLNWEHGSGQRFVDVWADTDSPAQVPVLLRRLADATAGTVGFERVRGHI
jgi:hypothetical protein